MRHSDAFAITNHFRPPLSVPGVTSYGAWTDYAWENEGMLQDGVKLVPESAPWRHLFEALDADAEVESAAPVSLLEEADAIVACCWRYGSYVHVLTAGESYPEFRKAPGLSRLSDSEMRRINLEFSSALAAWLSDRASEPETINRRVRAASRLLPMPWRSNKREWLQQGIEEHADRVLLEVQSQVQAWHEQYHPPDLSVRGEANLIVSHAYRNGPIEDLHAGRWNRGTQIPGFQRLYAAEVNRVSRTTVEKLALLLHLQGQAVSALPWLAVPFSPRGWSETDETATVEYPGIPGAGPLGARLRTLAARCPLVYTV